MIDQTGHVAYFNTEYDPDAMTTVIDKLLLDPSPVEPVPTHRATIVLSARPNPFNPRTVIHFDLPRSGRIDLDIHDARGRLVRRLVAGENRFEGPGSIIWDGTDDQGRSLPSGLYLARIRSRGATAIIKLTLVQ